MRKEHDRGGDKGYGKGYDEGYDRAITTLLDICKLRLDVWSKTPVNRHSRKAVG